MDANLFVFRMRQTKAYGTQRSDMNMRKKRVRCFEDCARCCEEMPIPLTLADIERIAAHLSVSVLEFFDTYCIVYPASPVMQSRSQGNRSYLSIAFMPPCPFLSEKKCSIYEVRPICCPIFPESIYYKNGLEAYRDSGYPCMSKGFELKKAQEANLLANMKKRREQQEESYRKMPTLRAGITYDKQIIQSASEKNEEFYRCNSPERRNEICRELMKEGIDYGMKIAFETVRKDMERLFGGK